MKSVFKVIEDFKKKHNFREVPRSCWNCKHAQNDTLEDNEVDCAHPDLVGEYADDVIAQCYIYQTANCVCDAWEAKSDEKESK